MTRQEVIAEIVKAINNRNDEKYRATIDQDGAPRINEVRIDVELTEVRKKTQNWRKFSPTTGTGRWIIAIGRRHFVSKFYTSDDGSARWVEIAMMCIADHDRFLDSQSRDALLAMNTRIVDSFNNANGVTPYSRPVAVEATTDEKKPLRLRVDWRVECSPLEAAKIIEKLKSIGIS